MKAEVIINRKTEVFLIEDKKVFREMFALDLEYLSITFNKEAMQITIHCTPEDEDAIVRDIIANLR